MLSKEIAFPATWEICQQNKWIQINSSRRRIAILIHGFLSSVLLKWSLSSTQAAVINTSSLSCTFDYWEYILWEFFWAEREKKDGEKKRKKTPTLCSDSGFEPLACPAVSSTALNLSLTQQWLICIKVLLSKGKAFEKNTELCVIKKKVSSRNTSKEARSKLLWSEQLKQLEKSFPFRQVTYSSPAWIKSENESSVALEKWDKGCLCWLYIW